MVVVGDIEAVLAEVKKIVTPWRRLVVAIDGRNGSGKTYLARFLAWKTGMPAIETDLWIKGQADTPDHEFDELRKLAERRLAKDLPLIIDGVCVLHTLAEMSLKSDYLIYVEREGYEGAGTWQQYYAAYEQEHRPRERADCVYRLAGAVDPA